MTKLALILYKNNIQLNMEQIKNEVVAMER